MLLGCVGFDLLDDKRNLWDRQPQKLRRRGGIAGDHAGNERKFGCRARSRDAAARRQEEFGQRIIAHAISGADLRAFSVKVDTGFASENILTF